MDETMARRLSSNTLNSLCRRCNHQDDEYLVNMDPSLYETDEFRMYKYKVILCPRQFSHDWTSCPFTHLGERAYRRDPRYYLPILCPFFKDDEKCRRGGACKFAHGLFEYFLHPGKYRTTRCTNGRSCERKVCFFAHTEKELRKEWELTPDQIHDAFAFDSHMPVAIAPRQVLRALSARSRTNTSVAGDNLNSPGPNTHFVTQAPIADPSASARKGKGIATDDSAATDPPALTFELSSPASIWSAALNDWPSDFDGLAEQLKEMVLTGRNNNSGEEAPVWTREYRLWN